MTQVHEVMGSPKFQTEMLNLICPSFGSVVLNGPRAVIRVQGTCCTQREEWEALGFRPKGDALDVLIDRDGVIMFSLPDPFKDVPADVVGAAKSIMQKATDQHLAFCLKNLAPVPGSPTAWALTLSHIEGHRLSTWKGMHDGISSHAKPDGINVMEFIVIV